MGPGDTVGTSDGIGAVNSQKRKEKFVLKRDGGGRWVASMGGDIVGISDGIGAVDSQKRKEKKKRDARGGGWH